MAFHAVQKTVFLGPSLLEWEHSSSFHPVSPRASSSRGRTAVPPTGISIKPHVASTSSSSMSSPPGMTSASQQQRPPASSESRRLSEKPVGELRRMARQLGLHGDTKAELIKLLSSSARSSTGTMKYSFSPSTASSFASSSSPPPLPSAASLVSMPLSELRAVARSRGASGATRAEILKELLGPDYAKSVKPTTPSSSAFDAPIPSTNYSPPPTVASKGSDLPAAAAAGSNGRPKAGSNGRSTPKAATAAAATAAAAAVPAAVGGGTAAANGRAGSTGIESQAAASGTIQASASGNSTAAGSGAAEQKKPAPFTPPSVVASATAYENELESKAIGELRGMAKKLGLHGDTKKELVKLLLEAVPVSSASKAAEGAAAVKVATAPAKKKAPAAAAAEGEKKEADKAVAAEKKPAAAAAAGGGGGGGATATPGAAAVKKEKAEKAKSPWEQSLEEMEMGELRYLARQRGIRGDTKEELVDALSSGPPLEIKFVPSSTPPPKKETKAAAAASSAALRSKPAPLPSESKPPASAAAAAAASAASAVPAPAAPASSKPAPSAAAGGGAVGRRAEPSLREVELMAKPLSELRALAREKGLRGDTKAEIVALLLKVPTQTPMIPSPMLAAAAAAITTPAPSQPEATPRPSSSPPTPSVASASSSAASATAAPAASRVAAVAAASAATSSTTVLPPFESDVASGVPSNVTPVPPEKLRAMKEEVSKLKAAMQAMRARDGALDEEKKSLLQEANFLRNVLVGGLGLAVVPLVLPLAISSIVQTTNPAEQKAIQLGQETTTLLESLLETQSAALDDLQSLLPLVSPDIAPEVRALKAEEFCQRVPPTLKSAQTEKFCNAISLLDLSSNSLSLAKMP